MNTKQIKKTLIDRDLTITAMARHLEPLTAATELSLRQMLSDMIYQRRWYPSLAELIDREFGIKFIRPRHYEPQVRMKQAA